MKQVEVKECTAPQAMAQVDLLSGLNVKQKNSLCLLTDEMFSMIKELLKVDAPDFSILIDGNRYSLRASAKARVSEEARQEFLSMSKDGRNAANKGVKGMFGAILDLLVGDEAACALNPTWMLGSMTPDGDYAYMWTLSQYVQTASDAQAHEAWDGMEKSIIACFADDVVIGVRSGKLEMTVIKAF